MEEAYVQWFPGHMTKTCRHIEKLLSQVDAVAEIVDARIPLSSRNPEIDKLVGNKPRILLLNKSDVADPIALDKWIKYYSERNIRTLPVSCRDLSGVGSFILLTKDVLKDKISRDIASGMAGKGIRIMIVGVPNVGKSTFINRLCKSSHIRVEDRPGVTRGEQWINLGDGVELLDTPGILWPKFEDPKVGEMLAFTGAVKDTVVDIETLAVRLITVLLAKYPNAITSRYNVSLEYNEYVYEILERIAIKRHFLQKGAQPDTLRAAAVFLDEFRSGLLGRISLEEPN